jgi:Rrf2 family iron-sulfur cluster assembly transcriptional regulator
MVSKKALHALNATVFIAQNAQDQPVCTQDISRALGVSVSYLEGMLKQLKDAGILQSFRGPGGGYQMGGGVPEVTVWDVISLFDPSAKQVVASRVLEERISPDYELQLSELVEEFLASQKISSRLGGVPIHLPRSGQSGSFFKFKPLPPPMMPSSPNSVFQLSAFTQRGGRN